MKWKVALSIVLIAALVGGGYLIYDNRKRCRTWRNIERMADRYDRLILQRDHPTQEAIEIGNTLQEVLSENRPLFC